jgi:hypothetical protein
MELRYENQVWNAYRNGAVIASSKNKDYVKRKVANLGLTVAKTPQSIVVEKVESMYNINDRFQFLDQLVRMVGNQQTPSCIITGEGGLGKSHTVMNALNDIGLTDISMEESNEDIADSTTYRVIKGYSTAKGLFRLLFENRESILVFDDCDSVLENSDAVNLLKGALDSFDKRIITWNSMSFSDDLPRTFEFKGGVIFISNLSADKISQALVSRAMAVDLSMTVDQKIERMHHILYQPSFLPNISLEEKLDAISLIREMKDQAKEISLRTLIKVSKIRSSGNDNWKDLAAYTLNG